MDHFTVIDRTPFEKVHLICCKHLLGTKNTSSNIGVKAELGKDISELLVKIGLTKHIKFINTSLSIKILEMKLHIVICQKYWET
jgi:hypothetical protein